MTTKLASRIMRTYPNGTMLIEAKKSMVVNRSRRDVILRGIVRPEDIDSKGTAPLMLLFSFSLVTCVCDVEISSVGDAKSLGRGARVESPMVPSWRGR
ncbi:MAG: flagellar basal body L-ring protein FlgH [Aquificaceae bacterium]|nr:flagellar basal body L-ring protein FlgH [Aquificaceae bacterium]